jgi:hypothetical protein
VSATIGREASCGISAMLSTQASLALGPRVCGRSSSLTDRAEGGFPVGISGGSVALQGLFPCPPERVLLGG